MFFDAFNLLRLSCFCMKHRLYTTGTGQLNARAKLVAERRQGSLNILMECYGDWTV